ncbi:MAG TPA: Ig-like domain-containing protein [Vicinamibacteria bacterium]|nr:Ig-like domain-containing protein [Vicinamibacteria bacterium]
MDRALRAGPAFVVRVDPRDGATGVFRDAPVVACLSHAADVSSVGPETFRVEEQGGDAVPGRLRLSPDRAVVIWTAHRLLTPGIEHVVTADGLRDARGGRVAPYSSRFVPCDLVLEDVSD